ncbi:MAG: molybdate ABC transporter substrate-binding protein [Chloroflexota bacterium]
MRLAPHGAAGPCRPLIAGLVLVTLVGLLVGCGAAGPPRPGTTTLTVFGAASLGPALQALGTAYRASAGIEIVVSTGSSTTLRTQIEQGAQPDVFLSADLANPEALIAAGLVDGPLVRFAGNQLAVVIPADNPGHLLQPTDLGRDGVRVVAAADGVPITAYASRLLAQLSTLPGAPADLAARYDANVVSREESVAAVLAKIELAEGDAAVVYASDASGSTKVTTLAIPVDRNVAASYGGVVPVGAANPVAARAFLTWLIGPEGQRALVEYGFSLPQ